MTASLLPLVIGFGTVSLGIVALFYTTLRSAAAIRADVRADLNALEGRLSTRMDAADSRLERMDIKIDRLDAKIDDKVDLLRSELRSEMREGFARVHQGYRDVRNRLDRLTDSLALRGLQLLEPGPG